MSNAGKQYRVVIPIYQGHMSRLLLQSGVIHKLVDSNIHVIVLTKHGANSKLKQDLPVKGITLEPLPLQRYRVNTLWSKVFDYLFQTVLPTSSARAREAWIAKTDKVRYVCIRLTDLIGRQRAAAIWNTVRRLLLPANLTNELWRRLQPDLVITGTLGKRVDEYYLLRGAQRHGTKSLCTMVSWDKLTTREYVLERPDKITVWNQYNAEEAVAYHGFKPEQIRVTGIPHFDVYSRLDHLPNREAFFAAMGLNPARKLIFVTPQPGHVSTNVTATMEILARMLHNEQFAQPLQIMIRPHPSVYAGEMHGQGVESDLAYYEGLHPNIHANRPVISDAGVISDTKASEMNVLAAVLHYADVMVDFYGTLSIEAAMLDTPVVYVDTGAFKTEVLKADPSGINYAEFTHLRHALELGAGRIVHNEEQLLHTINAFLESPQLDCEKRQKVVEKLCVANDGQSAQRLTNAIIDIVEEKWR